MGSSSGGVTVGNAKVGSGTSIGTVIVGIGGNVGSTVDEGLGTGVSVTVGVTVAVGCGKADADAVGVAVIVATIGGTTTGNEIVGDGSPGADGGVFVLGKLRYKATLSKTSGRPTTTSTA